MCFWYKILKPFYKTNTVPICCVSCSWAKNSKCTKKETKKYRCLNVDSAGKYCNYLNTFDKSCMYTANSCVYQSVEE